MLAIFTAQAESYQPHGKNRHGRRQHDVRKQHEVISQLDDAFCIELCVRAAMNRRTPYVVNHVRHKKHT